jgi:hypothetical protein
MAPQSECKKHTITAATNSLTEARAKVKEKLGLSTLDSGEHTESSRGDAEGKGKARPLNADEIFAGQPPVVTVIQEPPVITVTGEPVIRTVTQDADGQAVAQEAVVVTSIGPATTVVHVQTVVGEAVVATVTGEAVAVTVTQDAVAVTLWTVVEEEAPGGTAVVLPEEP